MSICSSFFFSEYFAVNFSLGDSAKRKTVQYNHKRIHRMSDKSSGNSSDAVISFKKPLRVRNELSEQRRKALKEYYKLKHQQQQQQQDPTQEDNGSTKNRNDGETETEDYSDDEALTSEILQDKPVREIDLKNAEFKEILHKTNKLTSSVNLINSSIKDIIYNNYYELIKLNDYLVEFNDLESSVYKTKEEKGKDSVQELLNYNKQSKESISIDDDQNQDGFTRLNSLMDKISQFEEIDFNKKIKTHDQSLTDTINVLIRPDNTSTQIKEELTKLLQQIKSAEGQPSLILQVESAIAELST